MPKGMSSRSGPPPDPNALRRERDADKWVSLPECREGPAPEWPLPTKATKAEAAMWKRLWTFPQAVMWERQNQQDEVALYVRRFIEASRPKSAVALSTAARQMADSLGITIPGMLRNRWRIEGAPAQQQISRPQVGVSSRERFKVVNGGA